MATEGIKGLNYPLNALISPQKVDSSSSFMASTTRSA